jgi:hypothetical protein
MFLLDDLILAPLAGLRFVFGQIQKVADRELNDESIIKEQLLELQMRLELDEVSDEDYKAQEADLFARLRVIKARQLELMDEIHTAESSSLIIEMGGED